MELDFMDKKNLQLFDKDLERYTLYLKQAQPGELSNPASLAEFRSQAEKLRKRLEPVKDKAHPDVQARLSKIDGYVAAVEAALAGAGQVSAAKAQAAASAPPAAGKDLSILSKDDEHRLKRIEGELEGEVKSLGAHEGTVLALGGKDGPFHAVSARLRNLFSNIAATGNAEVQALAARLAEYDALLEGKAALSRQKLAELEKRGETKAAFTAIQEAFSVAGFPPPLEAGADSKRIAAWARENGQWKAKLDDAAAWCALALDWSPLLSVEIELGNRLRRFLADKPGQFASALASVVEPWKSAVEKAGAIAPSAIPVDRLVNGAGEELFRMKEGISAAARLQAYQEASGDPEASATARIAAELSAAEKSLGELVDKAGKDYLADARMPEAVEEPELLKIAQSLIKDPYERLVVTRGILNHTGEEVQGLFVYATDYDIFWAAAVHRLEDGSYRMWDYSFCYSRKGAPGTVFNQWVMSDNWGGRKILKENIGK